MMGILIHWKEAFDGTWYDVTRGIWNVRGAVWSNIKWYKPHKMTTRRKKHIFGRYRIYSIVGNNSAYDVMIPTTNPNPAGISR